MRDHELLEHKFAFETDRAVREAVRPKTVAEEDKDRASLRRHEAIVAVARRAPDEASLVIHSSSSRYQVLVSTNMFYLTYALAFSTFWRILVLSEPSTFLVLSSSPALH